MGSSQKERDMANGLVEVVKSIEGVKFVQLAILFLVVIILFLTILRG